MYLFKRIDESGSINFFVKNGIYRIFGLIKNSYERIICYFYWFEFVICLNYFLEVMCDIVSYVSKWLNSQWQYVFRDFLLIGEVMELFLLSNSTLSGKVWLEYVLSLIVEQLQGRRLAVFIFFVGVTQIWDDYIAKTVAVFVSLGVFVIGIYSVVDFVVAIENVEIVIVGGGNIFQLLKQCRERGLLVLIIDVVKRGVLYIGWSVGVNFVCLIIRIINDMSIVDS